MFAAYMIPPGSTGRRSVVFLQNVSSAAATSGSGEGILLLLTFVVDSGHVP